MSRNHPGRSQNGQEWSRRVLEGSGRFHKFPDSTICAPPPLALGGNPSQGGWPKLGGGGATCGEESSLDPDSPIGRTPLHPLFRPRGLLATYIMRGGGGGATHLIPKAPAPPSLPLNPVAPQLDPGLDAVLDRNPLGFFSSSFLGGVLLWMAERFWIAATVCVDTGRGIITLFLLRGTSSSSSSEICSRELLEGFIRGIDRGTDHEMHHEIYIHPLHKLFFYCNYW